MPELSHSAVKTIRIHPAIGIARLGNHSDAYFIGPEIPGVTPKPINGYKVAGLVKRQGARFRLYAYDENDVLLGEVTAKEAAISWTVELANKKAEWKQFDGLFESETRRNAHVKKSMARQRLVVGPERHSLTGTQQSVVFDNSAFTAFKQPTGLAGGRNQRAPEARTVNNITLGEMITEKSGRLIVLGGYGQSGAPFGEDAKNFANNDGWYDDIADGPVDASVRFHGSKETIDVVGAWVVSAPPDFAPAIGNVVSMYDVLYDKAVQGGQLQRPPQPLFSRDIYPVLRRALNIRWVFDMGSSHQNLEAVLQPDAPDSLRQLIFDALRKPDGDGGTMPKLYKEVNAIYAAGLSLTPTQYATLQQWRDGEFIADLPTPPNDITPQGLDKAALDACVGGGLYPGVEMGWFLRDLFEFSEFLRLKREQPVLGPDERLQAGDLTKQMALPWQADFAKCAKEPEGESSYYGWWPAIRPDDVLPESGFRVEPWARGVSLEGDHRDMANKWFRLGFVVRIGDEYRETERSPELV